MRPCPTKQHTPTHDTVGGRWALFLLVCWYTSHSQGPLLCLLQHMLQLCVHTNAHTLCTSVIAQWPGNATGHGLHAHGCQPCGRETSKVLCWASAFVHAEGMNTHEHGMHAASHSRTPQSTCSDTQHTCVGHTIHTHDTAWQPSKGCLHSATGMK